MPKENGFFVLLTVENVQQIGGRIGDGEFFTRRPGEAMAANIPYEHAVTLGNGGHLWGKKKVIKQSSVDENEERSACRSLNPEMYGTAVDGIRGNGSEYDKPSVWAVLGWLKYGKQTGSIIMNKPRQRFD